MITLNTPLILKRFTLKNRLVMPPMATGKCGDDGKVSEDIINYYSERTAGGYIGLVITEHSYVMPEGKAHDNQLSVAEDSVIPGLRQLTDAIHANGSLCCCQINHAGSRSKRAVTGHAPVAPTAVLPPRAKQDDEVPEELTAEHIQTIINAFADAALRARQAGFDAVEIHASHGYLLNQFASPLTNTRADEYGKDRLLIHKRVISAVRAAVGDDYPLLIRIAGAEYIDGGLTVDDAARTGEVLRDCDVDIIDVTGGHLGYVRPGHTGPGYFAESAEAVRRTSAKPVILTGGIKDGSSANELLSSGVCDLTGVGRAIFKDPGTAKRLITESQK